MAEQDTNILLEKAKANQSTTDILLKMGDILLKKDSAGGERKWILESLYKKKDCSFGFASCESVDAGDYPYHVHCEVIEYIMCVKGSILFYINGQAMRVLKEGDCASVPRGASHKCKPLADNTKLFYICIPSDEAMPEGCEV